MIRALDSFRFFAFLAVFLFHAGYLDCGYLGVQAFFVLSGFLLTPILLEMKDSLACGAYFKNFYGRRALRIFPLYYAYLAIGGVAVLLALQLPSLSGDPALHRFLAELPWAASYTYDFLHAAHTAAESTLSPLLSHFWSLAVEEQFYLVWPLFLWLVPAIRRRTWLLGIVVAGPLIRALTWLLAGTGWLGGPGAQPDLLVYVLPFSHLDAFAIGGLLALRKEALPQGAPWLLAGLTLGSGALVWLADPSRIAVSSLGFPPFMSGPGQAVWGYTLFNLSCAVMLHALKRGAFLPVLFDVRPFRYLGKISYGLYVFHFPVMALINRAAGHTPPGLGRHALMLSVTIGISVLSYELFESRLLRLKDRWFPSR